MTENIFYLLYFLREPVRLLVSFTVRLSVPLPGPALGPAPRPLTDFYTVIENEVAVFFVYENGVAIIFWNF